ncbi:MAG: hypothetical protein KDA32_13405 [Phycisphaerales bacterium]|nr:hypothetical protein [Phycisphaerales bacterium]
MRRDARRQRLVAHANQTEQQPEHHQRRDVLRLAMHSPERDRGQRNRRPRFAQDDA